MIDTHCHLGLCEPDDARAGRRRARGSGCGGCSRVGIDEAASARGDRGGRGARGGVRRGRPPSRTAPAGSTTRRPSGSRSWRGTRGSRRSARPGSTTTATARRGGPAPRLPRPDRDRAAGRQAARDPRPRRRRDHRRRGARARRSSSCAPRRPGSSVILHCFSAPPERAFEAAEWGWYCSFAGNVTYPRSETAARGGARGARRAAAGRDRRPVPVAAAGAREAERAGERGRDGRGARRGARRRLRRARGDGRGERGARSSAGERRGAGSARTSSPTRTCSRRSSARRRSSPATSCSRSAAGRGR